MALGTNIEYKAKALFQAAYDEKSAKQVEDRYVKLSKGVSEMSRKEFVAAFSSLGQEINAALSKLKLPTIDMSKIIQLPQAEAFSQFGAEFGARFAEGFQGGISGMDISKQLESLTTERDRLFGQREKLQKGMRRVEYLADLPDLADMGEVRPFSDDQIKAFGKTVDEAALKIQDDFTRAEDQLSEMTRGTIEYQQALVNAYEAASNLYRMKGYIEQNVNKVQDKTIVSDYDGGNLADITADLFEHHQRGINNIESSYYEPELARISDRLKEIDIEIKNIQQNNPDIINPQSVSVGLKSLNEIEEAYKRILNAHGKIGKKGTNIQDALSFDPTSSERGIQSLYDDYMKLPTDSPWEIQYQALLKYVKLYESYLNSDNKTHRNKVTKEGNEFTKLYERLKPMAANAENMLQNVLNMANKVPLVGMGDATNNSSNIGFADTEQTAEAERRAAEEAERKAKADKEAAEAEAKARAEAETKAKADAEAAANAEKEKLAQEAAAKAAREKADARRAALVASMDSLGTTDGETGLEVTDVQTLEKYLSRRKGILELLQQEGLLTDEIRASYDAVNKEIQEKIGLLQQSNSGSHRPGSVLDNPLFASMFKKTGDDAEKKQAANEGSAEAAEKELNVEKQTTAELEKQQKLLLYRRVEGQVDINRIGNRSDDGLYNKQGQPTLQSALEMGYGGYGDGLYGSVFSSAKDLIPEMKDGPVSFFEFDASAYNLYINKTVEQAEALRTFLLSLQKLVGSGSILDSSQLTEIASLSEEQLFEKAQQIFKDFSMTKEQFHTWLENAKAEATKIAGLFAKGEVPTDRHNFGTRFMKTLGYEGVLNQTGDAEYDGNTQGSVIYDPNVDDIRKSARVFGSEHEFASYIEAQARAHRENTSAINVEAKAQERLNQAEGKNPQTSNAIKQEAISYDELRQRVVDYLKARELMSDGKTPMAEVSAQMDAAQQAITSLFPEKGKSPTDMFTSAGVGNMLGNSSIYEEHVHSLARALGIEIPEAAQKASGAIKVATEAQEKLNVTEGQNPPAQDDTSVHNANADAIGAKIKSYEELSAAVSRYVELAKTLVGTTNNTPEHLQIQRDMEIADMWGMHEREDYIAKVNEWQTNIGKIKSAIKIGADKYTTDDGYVENITDHTLSEAESRLRGYIYQYVENWDDVDALLAGAKTKTLKNIIAKEIGKYTADQDIQRQQEEIANAANAVALEEMERIERIIEDSALEEKKIDAWDKLTELQYRADKVDRFTQSVQTDGIANDLGITSPHQEIENNAKAIQSYEELCEVVQRYHELSDKRILFTGDENHTISAEEENEFADLVGRIRATGGGAQLTWREIEGDVNKLAQRLGIEIPQAAQQAESAVGKLNSELTETGDKADKIGGQGTGGTGTSAGAVVPPATGTSAEEVNNLENVRKKVTEIAEAVNTKTQAFFNEQSAVKRVAQSEVHALGEVEKKVTAIRVALSNIKSGADLGAGLSNVNINVKYPDTNTQQIDYNAIAEAIGKINTSTAPVTDVGHVLATENTLLAIKTAVESINGKVQQGTRVEATSKAPVADDNKAMVRYEGEADSKISGNGSQKPTEKINTALTALLKYKTTLQEANQLTGDLEVGINNLYAELSQVSDKEGLAVWNEHFKQFKNASSIIQTLVKDYQALGALQAKADAETDPTKLAHYLDNIQILQDRIAVKSVDVNVGDDRFDEAYSRAYSIERHALQQKQEVINATQVEADTVKRLIELYKQLGAAESKHDTNGIASAENEINLERGKLSSVDYATEAKFDESRQKGYLSSQKQLVHEWIELIKKKNTLEASINAGSLDELSSGRAENDLTQILKQIDSIYSLINLTGDVFEQVWRADLNSQDKANSSVTSKELPKLVSLYKQLGEAQARFDSEKTDKSNIDVKHLQEEISTKQKSLNISQEELAILQQIAEVSRRRKAESLQAEKDDTYVKGLIKEWSSLITRFESLNTQINSGEFDESQVEAMKKEVDLINQRINEIRPQIDMDKYDMQPIWDAQNKGRAEGEEAVLKQVEKKRKENLEREKKLAQKEAMVGPAGSAVRRAENTWMTGMSMGDVLSPELQAKMDEYHEKLDKLRRKHEEVKNSKTISDEQKAELIEQTQTVNKLTDEYGELFAEYQRLSGPNVKQIGTNILGDGADMEAYKKQLTDAVMALPGVKAQIKGFDATTKTLTYTVKTGANEFTEYTARIRGLDGALVAVQGQTKRTETFFEGLKRKTKEIWMYLGGSSIIYRAIAEVRKGIQYVREIDSALTELKKVTDETEESYERFLDTASKTASKVGSTVKEIVSSTADWSRLGYGMEEAHRLAESTAVLLNVSEFQSIDDATSALTSTLQAFGYTANQSMDVVDVLNEVGNNFAISSDGIATALQDSASSLMAANNSYQESVALIAAANRVVQDPNSVGKMLCRR